MKTISLLLAAGVMAILSYPLAAQEQSGTDSAAPTTTGTAAAATADTAGTVDETTLPITTGDTTGQAAPAEVNATAIGISDLIRTIVVLLLVIGSIYLVMYLLRRFSTTGVDGSSLIKVVGSRGIMKDSAVHLIEVGNQVFLVGTGNSSVNLISEITDQETIDNIRLNQSEETSRTGGFAQRIAANLGLGGRKKAEEQVRNAETFLRSQRDRLKDL